ncbi:MAG: GNAT family N-acetyltransferase, partial [candidate division Zixibacteria bacterium]|nr:GNAT family N-acetyltransferase [candidate division Zixibacteria bacterium]
MQIKSMDIQPLTIEHLEFRLAEEPGCQRNWFVPHMRDLIRYQPDGCFALCDGDDVIGMVTTTPYQAVGWIGWLYVAERCRERGLGARLMQAAVSYLQNA